MPRSWIDNSKSEKIFSKNMRFKVANTLPDSIITIEDDELKDSLKETLALWALLYDIPLQYLLPNWQLLPENSLRFFYLDENWVRALLDGALSIGRDLGVDKRHDENFIDEIYDNSLQASAIVRARLQGKNISEVIPSNGKQEKIYSGFLMRSPLVIGWRGLEFEALGENQEILQAVRIENLTSDILLGIYIGEIKRLTIYEPPEGLNNQVVSGADKKYLRLRNIESGKDSGETIDIPFKNQHRIVDLKQLSIDINKVGITCTNGADLALQFLKLPSYATFFEEKGV